MPFAGATKPQIAAVIVACSTYEQSGSWGSPTTAFAEVKADYEAWTARYGSTYALWLAGPGSAAAIDATLVRLKGDLATSLVEQQVLFVFLGVGGWVKRGNAPAEAVICVPETHGEALEGAIPLSDLAAMFTKHLPYHAVTAVFDCGFKDDGSPRAIPGAPRAVVRPGVGVVREQVRLRDIDRVIPSRTPVPAVEPGAYGQNGAITAALLETFFSEVEIDPGTVAFKPYMLLLPDGSTVGTLVIIGMNDIQTNGVTWQAKKEHWYGAGAAWTWPTGQDFHLVPMSLNGLPPAQSTVILDNLAFDAAHVGRPAATGGWRVHRNSVTVGWLEPLGGGLRWFALGNTTYFAASLGQPLFFEWTAAPPAEFNVDVRMI